MSASILKYTTKLHTNLINIRKHVDEIQKKTGKEREDAVLNLYCYFKSGTHKKVNLFAGIEPQRCLSVEQCIHRDIEYLRKKCDTDLTQHEKKDYCISLVESISAELLKILSGVEKEVDKIFNTVKITSVFLSHLNNESKSEIEYLKRKINIDSDADVNVYRDEITDLINKCYNGNIDRENKIQWIVYGYIYGKNRKFEDWLPSVNSLFLKYDNLVEQKIISENTIRFNTYDKKNLNGGLKQLEDIVNKYSADKKNYKVYNKLTNEEIDFSQYKDNIHSDSSFVYTDPQTGDVLLRVIAPKSMSSSVYWGWGTKWCTSRIDKSENNIFENNMFGEYYYGAEYIKRLYILEFKSHKYQVHFTERQFMDSNDEPAHLQPDEKLLMREWFATLKNKIPTDTLLEFALQFQFIEALNVEYEYVPQLALLSLRNHIGDTKYLLNRILKNDPEWFNNPDNIDPQSLEEIKMRYGLIQLLPVLDNSNLSDMLYTLVKLARGRNFDDDDTDYVDTIQYLTSKLLEINPDVLFTDKAKEERFLKFCISSNLVQFIDFVISKGASQEYLSKLINYSMTPNDYTLDDRNMNAFKYLFDKMKEYYPKFINKKRINEYLMRSLNSTFQIFKFMVDLGGDIFQKDNTGRTTMTIAFKYKNSDIIQYLQSKEVTIDDTKDGKFARSRLQNNELDE
jgi:hypothetical protein